MLDSDALPPRSPSRPFGRLTRRYAWVNRGPGQLDGDAGYGTPPDDDVIGGPGARPGEALWVNGTRLLPPYGCVLGAGPSTLPVAGLLKEPPGDLKRNPAVVLPGVLSRMPAGVAPLAEKS